VTLAPVPPAVVFLAAAVVVRLAPRRIGHAVGVLAAAATVPWLLGVPAGAHLPGRLYGFAVVLFNVDPVARLVGLVFAFVAAANVLYAYGSGATRGQTATATAYMGASLGAVFAGDWLTLVVWWELMAVTATVLVWQSPAATRAAYRYAVYHQLGSVLLIAGVLAQFAASGTFLFVDGVTAGLPRLLAAGGVALNVGVLGFHVWLVDTYPTPHVAVSVVLCGFTTKVGVYALHRVVPDGSLVVAYLGAAMLVVGVTLAVLQTTLRRLLTYHIVSQVGYMVAGVGLASTLAIDGAFAHLVNNVLYKTLLFMVAGVLVLRTGEESLKRLGGLWRAMPATTGAFLVAALAITGTPGLAGFVSKGLVVDSAETAGLGLLWWLLVGGGVGTVLSFAKFGYYAFVREPPGDGDGGVTGTADRDAPADANRAQALALALLAVPCVAVGVAPDLLLSLLPGGAPGAKVFAASQFEKAGATLLVGLVAFVALRGPLARVSHVPDLDAVYHPAGAALRDRSATALQTVARGLDRAVRGAVDRTGRLALTPDAFARLGLGASTLGRAILLVALTAALAVASLVFG
jgi:multicomponent Na+:H+ antiporter subunit D